MLFKSLVVSNRLVFRLPKDECLLNWIDFFEANSFASRTVEEPKSTETSLVVYVSVSLVTFKFNLLFSGSVASVASH